MIQQQLYEWITHPERLNRDTLYELRTLLARYPYFQTVRLLYLKNLFLLHDITFGGELRKAALYVADRKILFYLIEGERFTVSSFEKQDLPKEEAGLDRTLSLIDTFLSSLPEEPVVMELPMDVTTDYTSFLLHEEEHVSDDIPQMKGQNLIDNFIEKSAEEPLLPQLGIKEAAPVKNKVSEEEESEDNEEDMEDESYFTETLAKIYFQLFALAPACNIAKAVFSCLNSKIFADCIGDAFSLHFFRVTIFPLFLQKLGEGRKATGKIQPFFLGQHQASIFRQFQRLCHQNGACMVYNHSFFHTDRISRIVVRTAQIIAINALWQIIASNPSVGEQTKFIKQLDLLILLVIGNLDLFLIVELAVSNLVNRGRNRLHLAHALTNGNFLMISRKIAVRISSHCFKSNRHRCAAAQGLHECLIIWHIAGKG